MTRNQKPGIIKDPAIVRGLTIFLLVLILLIPLMLIGKTVDERAKTRLDAENKLIKEFGGEQAISGPIIVIPYLTYIRDSKGNVIDAQSHKAFFLPEKINISGNVEPEIRKRSIYEFILYTGDLKMTGSFSSPDFSQLKTRVDRIMWDDAYIELETSDMKGFRKKPDLIINQKNIELDTELSFSGFYRGGLSGKLNIDEKSDNISFEATIAIQGGKSISFVPIGDETTIELTSSWNDPSFFGDWLPNERTVSESDGFSAKWYIMSISRNFKSVMDEDSINNVPLYNNNTFGVRLIKPVDIYLMTERCIKYGILFIILPFLTFFMFEIFSKVKVHPFHYMFVGITACIFFLLLIALSEHSSFIIAFISGATAVSGLITYYASYFLKSIKRGLVLFPVMAISYFFMYMMINSQDYALLMGSISIFTILAGVMIATRKVDWYKLSKPVS